MTGKWKNHFATFYNEIQHLRRKTYIGHTLCPCIQIDFSSICRGVSMPSQNVSSRIFHWKAFPWKAFTKFSPQCSLGTCLLFRFLYRYVSIYLWGWNYWWVLKQWKWWTCLVGISETPRWYGKSFGGSHPRTARRWSLRIGSWERRSVGQNTKEYIPT